MNAIWFMSRVTDRSWVSRFFTPRYRVPLWSIQHPDRLVYHSTKSGKWEVHARDLTHGSDRQVTDRPTGTTDFALDPCGRRIWWFDDHLGNESGVWRVTAFEASVDPPLTPLSEPSYSTGLVLARNWELIGTSSRDMYVIYLTRAGRDPVILHRSKSHIVPIGASSDGTYYSILRQHRGNTVLSAHGVDLNFTAELLLEGEGRLSAGPWSPVENDHRMVATLHSEDDTELIVWEPVGQNIQRFPLRLPGENRCLDWFPDGGSVLIRNQHRGYSSLYRLYLSSGDLLRHSLPPGTVSDARVRPNGEVWLSWSDSRTAESVHTGTIQFDMASTEPMPINTPYTELTVGDIHGFLGLPSGDGPHPAVFLLHGGPFTHDSDSYNPQAQAWLDRGFAVVLVNYRGSTGYGSTWRTSIIGDPGSRELADIDTVREHLVASGVVDEHRIILSGHSWGGYLALLAAGTQPTTWSLIIAEAPVADYIAAFQEEMESLRQLDILIFSGTPQTQPELYRERSPITHAQRIIAPILLLASRFDPRCPLGQVQNFADRLDQLGATFELQCLDIGHGAHAMRDAVRKIELQFAFAKRYLPSDLDALGPA